MVEMQITVHVEPKARSRGVALEDDGTLCVRVNVPPEGSKENETMCDLLTKVQGGSKTEVCVVSGHGARLKTVAEWEAGQR